jgi:Fe-S oxidoreductase
VGGLELCPVERGDECCGFGGAFSVEYPELSGRIGAPSSTPSSTVTPSS